MAHTDRDDERWMRYHHGKHSAAGECTYRSGRAWTYQRTAPQSCEICDRLWPGRRYFKNPTGTFGTKWRRAERRVERNRAAQALREVSDYDELVIDYRRPYWD